MTTQLGDDRFTAFRTGTAKSRAAFLALLRAGYTDCVVNAAALDYMRRRSLSGPVIETLAAHPVKLFADVAAWRAHLAQLGIGQLQVTPDPVLTAAEGALRGAIRCHGLLSGTVIVSKPVLGPAKPDPWDAGQFRVGSHALCWVHAERLARKLVPAAAEQRRAVEATRALIWRRCADLKAWQRDPCPRRAAALRARFDRIFRRRTGCVVPDRLLARLHRRKDELLRVLWAQARLCPSSPTSRCTQTARRTACAPA